MHLLVWLAQKNLRRKPEPKYYSGEIVCVYKYGNSFTVGKVYKVKDGKFLDDNGRVHGTTYPYVSLEDINGNHFSSFAELIR